MPESANQIRQESDLTDTALDDPNRAFGTNEGDLIADTLVPSIEQGIAPLTALGGSEPVMFDLSGAASRRTSERIVGAVLWMCGAISLLTTVGIIVVLIQEALVFFSTCRWRTFSSEPHGPRCSNRRSTACCRWSAVR